MAGRTWRRWLVITVAVVMAVVVTLTLASWGASRSAWGRGQIRQLIESQAARALDGTLHIDDVSGSIVNGVTLTGVRFTHGGRDVLTARSIEARFSLWGWIRGGREISLVRLIDPVIEITEQHNNFDAANWIRARPSSGGPSVPVRLPRVEIVNGRLVTSAHESVWRLPADIRELNGQFAVRVGGGTQVDIEQLTFSAVSPAGPVPVFRARAVTGTLVFHGDTDIQHLRVESDAGAISVTGRIGAAVPHPIELGATLDRMQTASWRRFTPLLDTIDLTANGNATLGGNVDRLTVRTALTTSAGGISGDVVVANQSSQLQITGTAQLAAFDAERVTHDPLWSSSMTAQVKFRASSSGSPAAWTVNLDVAGGPVRAFGGDADLLNGSLRYVPGLVTFSTDAHAYGATAHASGTLTLGKALVVDVAGNGLSHLDPRKLPAKFGFTPLEADLNASAFVAHWTSGHWTVQATLESSQVEGATFDTGTVVDLASAPGAVRVTADGRMHSLDAQRLGHATGLTGLDSATFATMLNGHVKLSGEGKDWSSIDLTATAELAESHAAGNASIPSAIVNYTRRARLNTAHVTGAIAGLHPERLGAPAALASDINGQADVTFVWRDDVADVAGSVVARGTLRAGPSTIAALPVDRGLIVGEWRDGGFTAESAELQNRGVALRGHGRVAVSKGDSDAAFDVTASDVTVLQPWSGRTTRGAATAHGQLTGAFNLPRTKGTFESPHIADPSLGTFDGLAGTLDVEFPEWVLDRMRGDLNAQAVTWSGDKAKLADAVTAQLHFTTRFHTSAAAFQGQLNEMTVKATLSSMDWEHETTADVATFEARRGARVWQLDPASGSLRVTTSHVTAHNVQLMSGNAGRAVVDGRVALGEIETGGDPADQITLRVTGFDLAAMDEFFGLTTGATGVVSGEASLVGRLSDPRGRITAQARDLVVRGYRIADVGGTVDLANGAATSAITLKQPDAVTLKITGRAPLSWLLPEGTLDPAVPSPLWDLALAGDPIDLKILATVWPTVTDLAGRAVVDLKVVGAAATPTVTGKLAIADGSFALPAMGTSFSKILADLDFGVDRVTVKQFAARDKHDHLLKVTGELAVKERQLGHVDVHVDADRVSVLDNGIGELEVSSLLELTGDVSHPRLNGNIEFSTGRIEVDRLLRALEGDPSAFVAETDLPKAGVTTVDLRADAAAAAAEAAARKPSKSLFDSQSFLSSLAVDVQVFAPDNVILRGNKLRPGGRNGWSLGDLNVTVGGELQATRAPGSDIALRGDVTMIRGVYSFESRRFEIQRGGRIRFQGESPIDPMFDIRGVRSIQGVEARVDVRGRLSAPSLQLGSNLPLDEADVLSMIVFNRPVNQLGDTQRADLVGAAASLAGGYVTAPLAQSLSRVLALDLLEVETVTFGQNVAPRVRVGQQLTSRLFVQLSQQFGSQSLSELTAEFRLAKFLRLQGSTAQGPGSRAQRSLLQRVERAGLDLLFFFNY